MPEKWVGLSPETPAGVGGAGSVGDHTASCPTTSSFTDEKKVPWRGVTFRGSSSKWGPHVRLGLGSGGAGQVACSLGWPRPGAGGTSWPGGSGGRRPPAFWPPESSAFVLCFPSARAPVAFQASPDCAHGDKRADEREISGSSRSPRADTVAAGGRPRAGGPGPGIGLTTSYTECSSEGFCMWLSESLQQPWEESTAQSTEEGTDAPESGSQDRNPGLGDFQRAVLTLALTCLQAQMTPGLVEAVLPLRLELAIFRLSRKREWSSQRESDETGSHPPTPGEAGWPGSPRSPTPGQAV